MKKWCWLCALLMLVGCGKEAEQKVSEKLLERALKSEHGGDFDVKLTEHGISIKGEDGEMTFSEGAGTELPRDFPADVLVYKQAKIRSAVNTGEGRMVMLSSSDKPARVAESYQKDMASKGWTQERALELQDQTLLVFSKEGRTANVAISSGENETEIALTVVSEE